MARARVQAPVAGPVEEPWKLPDGWRWERLGDVAPVNRSRNISQFADDTMLTFVGMAAVEALSGKIDVSAMRPAAEVRQGFTRFGIGDVLFAKITPCMENGKVAVVPEIAHGVGCGSTEFHVLSPVKVTSEYLYHWVSQRSFRETAEFHMTGTAGQKRVPPDFMRDAAIAVPPIEVQRQIVARIEELFTEIEDGEAALARARADLGTWRKALLKAAVTGDLTADWRVANPPTETGADFLARILAERRTRWLADPRHKGKRYVEPAGPHTESLPALPERWEWTNVGQLSLVDSGGTPPGIEAASQPAGEVPWFKVSSMTQPGNGKYLTHSKWWLTRDQALRAGLRIFPAGSMIFPKLGGALLTNKRRLLYTDACLDLNNMAVSPMSGIASYLWQLFSGIDLADLSDGSVVPQLKRNAVEAIHVALPPERELAEVVSRLTSSMDEAEALLSWSIEMDVSASTLRQSILAAAFRGALAV